MRIQVCLRALGIVVGMLFSAVGQSAVGDIYPLKDGIGSHFKLPFYYSAFPWLNTTTTIHREHISNILAEESIDPFTGVLTLTHPDLVVPGTGLDIILTRTLSTYNAHYMETGNMEDYYNGANYDSSGLGWHLARDFGFFVTSYLDPSKCTPVNKLYGEDIPLIEQDEDRNYLSARETAFDNPFMLSVTAGARSFYATSPPYTFYNWACHNRLDTLW